MSNKSRYWLDLIYKIFIAIFGILLGTHAYKDKVDHDAMIEAIYGLQIESTELRKELLESGVTYQQSASFEDSTNA
jgi:hypothetical protein